MGYWVLITGQKWQFFCKYTTQQHNTKWAKSKGVWKLSEATVRTYTSQHIVTDVNNKNNVTTLVHCGSVYSAHMDKVHFKGTAHLIVQEMGHTCALTVSTSLHTPSASVPQHASVIKCAYWDSPKMSYPLQYGVNIQRPPLLLAPLVKMS